MEPAVRMTLTIDGPFGDRLAADDDNLVLRAARMLSAAAGGSPGELGAAIRLTKRLPVAAGIGGGSADAAATLLGLDRLWQLDLGDARLRSIGLGLGADVPVCLAGVASHVGGIGEQIESAPFLPIAHLVLANPGVPLATATVFRRRSEMPHSAGYSRPARLTEPPVDVVMLAGRLAERRNDLAEAASDLVPEIAEVLAALEARPDCLLARLSGSGATCFGIFADRGAARATAAALARAHPDWWVAATTLTAASQSPVSLPTTELQN